MNQQFEYSYIEVKLSGGYWSGAPDRAYRKIIDAKANEGWRFVQAFAPAVGGYGKASKVDLIFERKLV
ncbi:DUF4177 domain-containing protein [Coraliomargarita akajimensis]|uniref:DUF4177 domain-containing protein n=1 Tax=Coraliomargarita akajimensis (strain DSM 45221 / IAM 15411 / JCM 23193 / KCTC 12865 / 04OKA010-24) TaxID=583355 RepID=D5ELY1_CORAD|nr:DUF4177 domain-containing protein [Coraliomargarita akajimensis]ADE53306.1 conserved hypothetical protein [Coraliomargarita akajimensis DSM 45221]